MLTPGRKFDAGSGYRYGFNSKENDKDISAGAQDYGMRISDARIGKFLSVDPLTPKYPELTPYQFASNSPVWGVDLDGLELRIYTEITGITGHAFLTVGSGKDMVVYSFGRYAGVYKTSGVTSGALSPTGPGVLVRLKGDKATKFVREELVNNKAKSFEIKDGNETKTKGYMDKIFNSSTTVPKVGAYKDDPDAHIVGDYSLLGNSCVTKTIDGTQASGTKLDFTNIWSVISPGGASTDPNASPLGLQVYLEGEAGGKIVKDATRQVKNQYTEFKIVTPNLEHPITDHQEDNQAKRNAAPINITPKKKT